MDEKSNVLNQNNRREVYATDGQFTLFFISDADRENYVELHRQINGEDTLFLNPACKDLMWEQTLTGKDKVFSIFDDNGEYCGSLELQRDDSKNPEIGIDLLENKRNKGIASKVVKLLARKAYENNPVEFYLIRISSRNPHSKHVFEKMGAIPIGIEESRFNMFIKNFQDAFNILEIDEELQEKLGKFFDEDKYIEEEIVYKYKLMPEIFLQK